MKCAAALSGIPQSARHADPGAQGPASESPLKPGESRKLHFDLDARALSSVTEAGDRIVAPGSYRLMVGGGQPGTGAPVSAAGFSVIGEAPLPK